MNKKRLIRVMTAVVATAAIIAGIIVGCGPEWGDGAADSGAARTAANGGTRSNAVSVTLPSYYAKNMVFQRGKSITVKGAATATDGSNITGKQLTATIIQGESSDSATARIGKNGTFSCSIKAQKASLKPYSLMLSYNGSIVYQLSRVYVGDVFVAAGQSNMELNYTQYYSTKDVAYNFGNGLITEKDLPRQLVDSNVHFVIADHVAGGTSADAKTGSKTSDDFPLVSAYNESSSWLSANNHDSRHLSYLAQQFAMQLRAKHPNVPIGIIQTAWGGTPISRHLRGGDIYANHIAPLRGFHVAGVLWYQGCDDSMRSATAMEYETNMTALINQYRTVFDQEDLPFLYVQLARWPNYQYTQDVRFAQLRTLNNVGLRNTSNVGMTVSIDTDKGTSALIHPLGKDILGARMAAQYLAMTEDSDNDGASGNGGTGSKASRNIPSGPIISSARHAGSDGADNGSTNNRNGSSAGNGTNGNTDNGTIVLTFRNGTDNGLKAMKPNYSKTASATVPNYAKHPKATPLDGIFNVATNTSQALQGFEVADGSGKWVSVNATIKGNQVVLSSTNEDLGGMTQVRYLWSGNPSYSSILYNKLGLPASPFIAVVD